MTKLLPATLLATLALLLAWPAEAQEIQYKLRNRVPTGQQPAVIMLAGEPLKVVRLEWTRSDGKRKTFEKRNVKAGAQVEVVLPQKSGAFDYKATLKFIAASGKRGEAAFTFDAVVAANLELSLKREGSDVDAKRVILTANAPVKHGELAVLGDGGVPIEQRDVDLSGKRAGDDLVFTWSGEGSPRKIEIKIHDMMGFWRSVEVIPFTVSIPHDEVNFDSGKASFGPTEAKKLDRTYALLRKELDKYGRDLQIRLYIAGYTDTVGSKKANLGLSSERAKAIAAYFRRKGLKIPIFYQGFGEDVPLVKTGDEVDEVRNRRALYILGNQKPPTSAQIPSSNWRPLR